MKESHSSNISVPGDDKIKMARYTMSLALFASVALLYVRSNHSINLSDNSLIIQFFFYADSGLIQSALILPSM